MGMRTWLNARVFNAARNAVSVASLLAAAAIWIPQSSMQASAGALLAFNRIRRAYSGMRRPRKRDLYVLHIVSKNS
jgi:hypothetical protein